MKKNIIPAVLLLISLTLTGCSEGIADSTPNSTVNSSNLSGFESIPDSSLPDDNSSETESKPLSRDECGQIAALFKDWGDLDYNIHPDQTNTDRSDYFPECVDASRFITDEVALKGSNRTYTEYFYMVISGDYSTEKGFNQKLDDMFTEKFKEKYFASSSGQMFRFKDDETYVAGFGHYNETEPEISLRLSAEVLDEDTIEISVANVIDGENGGQEYKATLVRAENGNYKIDDVGSDDGSMFKIPQLFHYKSAEVVLSQNDKVLFSL